LWVWTPLYVDIEEPCPLVPSPGPSLFLVQKNYQDKDSCPIQEGSSKRSRAEGNTDGKVSFRDGLSRGAENGDEASVRKDDWHRQ
jgi:hypothetical protein